MEKVILRGLQLLRWSSYLPPFRKPEHSLPCSQEPTTRLSAGPVKSSPSLTLFL